MKAQLRFAPKRKLHLHGATISHRHGFNVYVQPTEDLLEEELAEYCRDNWNEVAEAPESQDPPQEPPENDADCIETYFQFSEWHDEHLDYDTHEVSVAALMKALRAKVTPA